MFVRVAFVRGGRSRGGSRTHNGLLTDEQRAAHGHGRHTGTGGKTGAQGGEKAHHLLHTGYKKIDVYKFA